MGLVIKAANDGSYLRQNDLPALLTYGAGVTYGAIRVSVRFLEEQGMLERVKSGRYQLLVPLERGYDWFRPAR